MEHLQWRKLLGPNEEKAVLKRLRSEVPFVEVVCAICKGHAVVGLIDKDGNLTAWGNAMVLPVGRGPENKARFGGRVPEMKSQFSVPLGELEEVENNRLVLWCVRHHHLDFDVIEAQRVFAHAKRRHTRARFPCPVLRADSPAVR